MSETNSSAPAAPTQSSQGSPNNQPTENSPNENMQESNSQGQNLPKPTPQKRKFKYKADNQEVEEELTDEDITSRLSLAKAAHKRMNEASMTKKQVEQFVKQLQNDPIAVLSDPRLIGNEKLQKMFEDYYIKNVIEPSTLTPEQKRQRDNEQRLKQYEEMERRQKEEYEQHQAMQLEQQFFQQLEKTVIDTLQSSGLPVSDRSVARMAKYLDLQIKNPEMLGDLTPQILAEKVKQDIADDLKFILKTTTAEQIISMFGDELSNKIRKHDLSKFQLKNPVPPKERGVTPQEPVKKQTYREWEEELRNKFAKK